MEASTPLAGSDAGECAQVGDAANADTVLDEVRVRAADVERCRQENEESSSSSSSSSDDY